MLFGVFFHFYSNSNSVSKQWIPNFAASDLGLHCLPMYHKKDAWLKLVKYSDFKCLYLL